MNRIIWLLVLLLVFSVGCTKRAEKLSSQLPEEAIVEETIDLEKQISDSLQEQPSLQEKQAVLQPALQEAAPATETTAIVSAKPSAQEIQQALKNAGFYQYNIDGVIGPKTKKAIEDFQAQNSLKVDGKVGPKTWEKLSPYLKAGSSKAAE